MTQGHNVIFPPILSLYCHIIHVSKVPYELNGLLKRSPPMGRELGKGGP